MVYFIYIYIFKQLYMDYLVSLNIISSTGKLLNNSNVPILFYWDNDDETLLENKIFEYKDWQDYIEDVCLNIKEYAESKISYFKYNIKSESIEQNTFNIQHYYLLQYSDRGKKLSLEYLVAIFKYLYKYALKEEYKENEDQSYIDIIIDIYHILKERNQKKILPETVRNYILSELQQKYKLSVKNMDYVLTQYDNIIKDILYV